MATTKIRYDFSNLTLWFLLGVAWLLSACNTLNPQLTPTPLITDIPFETIEREERVSGRLYEEKDPKIVVVPNAEMLSTLEGTISNEAKEALLVLDYERYFGVVVYRGLQTSLGYEVTVNKVELQQDGSVIIYASFQIPKPDEPVASILSSPLHIIQVEKRGLHGETKFSLVVDGAVGFSTSVNLP